MLDLCTDHRACCWLLLVSRRKKHRAAQKVASFLVLARKALGRGRRMLLQRNLLGSWCFNPHFFLSSHPWLCK